MPSVRIRNRAKGPMFTALYRDPSDKQRSAGTFTSERAALRAARRAESKVETGGWIDQASGRVTFRDYVENVWVPSRHVEVSTMAGYHSYLDKHFLPFFGDHPMADILPSARLHDHQHELLGDPRLRHTPFSRSGKPLRVTDTGA